MKKAKPTGVSTTFNRLFPKDTSAFPAAHRKTELRQKVTVCLAEEAEAGVQKHHSSWKLREKAGK